MLIEHMETFLQGEEGYTLKYFKQKLIEKYGEDIVITSIPGNTPVVSFHDSVQSGHLEKLDVG